MVCKAEGARLVKRYDLIVIGAGPAGLSAAIEAAKCGMKVGVFDENARPGGQLFKQIHKFFGSKEHKAKIRGFQIGNELLEEAKELLVDVHLNTVVMGIYEPLRITVNEGDRISSYAADNIVIATGASENMVPYDGWTLPGVIGAGAAQTLMNLHGVLPGKRVLMVGSGNVGLVVSFQLLQAGCQVVAVIDAAPRIGGYGVHAAKVARTGVPFYLSHTIVRAEGDGKVEKVIIAQVDERWNVVPGTEKELEVDTICMAVGLSPMSQLARLAGCWMEDKGGLVPCCDEFGQTSVEGVFAAGDVAGIEEASSAMIGGRIAALGAARRSGFLTDAEVKEKYDHYAQSLDKLRRGMFSHENKGRTDLVQTDEGYPLSMSLLKKGYLDAEEVSQYPGVGTEKRIGIHPVIECTQNIPCNPCQDACHFGCIQVGDEITALPQVVLDSRCTNCGLCVASCSGQAIFLVDETSEPGFATITIPYEFLPLPQSGEKGMALDRSGKPICDAEVVRVKTSPAFDHTALLTMRVPQEMSGQARFFRRRDVVQ